MFVRTPSPSSGLPAAHKSHPHNRPTTPTPINQPPAKTMKKASFVDEDTSDEDDVAHLHQSLSDLPTIPCLCTTIATYTTIHHTNTPMKCVGILTSTNKHEHRVWTLLQQFPKPARLVSLTDLITTYTNTLDQPSRENRLVLGLKLISSVLQLNATQWLTERWEAKDILFPEADLAADYQHNILSRPFVHRNFNSNSTTAPIYDYPDPQHQPTNQAKAVIGYNQALYSLGVVLLEIWHWQTFSSLYNSSAKGRSEFEFSYYLSGRLSEEAGYEYAMAVRGCIRGFEMLQTDLEDDLFRRKVYQDVLGLLEDNLRKFSGSDNIQKIIGEE